MRFLIFVTCIISSHLQYIALHGQEAPEQQLALLLDAVRQDKLSEFYQNLSVEDKLFSEQRWAELKAVIAIRYSHQFDATLLLLKDPAKSHLLEQSLKKVFSFVQNGTEHELAIKLQKLLGSHLQEASNSKRLLQQLSAFLYKDLSITNEQIKASSQTLHKTISALQFNSHTEFHKLSLHQIIPDLQDGIKTIKEIAQHLDIPIQSFLDSIHIDGHEIDINNRKCTLSFIAFKNRIEIPFMLTRNGQAWSIPQHQHKASLTP